MSDFFRHLFSMDFMPHVYCLRETNVISLHVASDALIALSYFAIPIALARLVMRRKDLVFSWMFLLFGAFILSCGITHLLSIWTLWHPIYRFEGLAQGDHGVVLGGDGHSAGPVAAAIDEASEPSGTAGPNCGTPTG